LVEYGNALVDGGFIPNPVGWTCRLARPIDFSLLRSKFVVPKTIRLSAEYDTILDERSWCAIEGPGADPV